MNILSFLSGREDEDLSNNFNEQINTALNSEIILLSANLTNEQVGAIKDLISIAQQKPAYTIRCSLNNRAVLHIDQNSVTIKTY